MATLRFGSLFLGFSTVLAMVAGCRVESAKPMGGAGGTSTEKPAEKPVVNEPWAKEATGTNRGKVEIDGSSTVFPVTEAVAEEFRKVAPEVKVTVGISGTGGGFKRFAKGETDISDASRPILAKEIEDSKANSVKYIELPICFDALTVAVHPQNDWCDAITVAELKKIWEPSAQEKITKWSQVREGWPDEPIQLFGAGSDSGTFDYFTEAIVGKAKQSRGDYTPSEDDNVLVQGIAGSKYSLGYLPYSYFVGNPGLKAVKIKKDDAAEGVEPSLDNVLTGKYFPLSRPLFIYVSEKALERPETRKFCEFYLENVAALAQEVHYLPLPNEAYVQGIKRLRGLKTGSVFGGVPETNVTIEDVMSRELKE